MVTGTASLTQFVAVTILYLMRKIGYGIVNKADIIGYSIAKMAFRLLPIFYHCRNAVPVASLRRPYSQPPHHKRTPHYNNFRKSITALRSQLVEEHKLKEKMANEDLNSQAAQEVRMEKEREEKALEQNEKEIQRMAERRL